MNTHHRAPDEPSSSERLDHVRRSLLVAVDDLRTLLINDDDLHRPAGQAVHEPLEGINELADTYQAARRDAETPPDAPAARHPRRRYVNPGDTILVVLPERPRHQHASGRRARVHVAAADAELDLTDGPGHLPLGHADAGIHPDPDTDQLSILALEGEQR